nr:hypothetical protein [Mesorhizobium ventifaucium]
MERWQIGRLDVFAPAAERADLMGFPAWAVGRITVRARLEPDEIGPVRPVGRDDVEITIPVDIDKARHPS